MKKFFLALTLFLLGMSCKVLAQREKEDVYLVFYAHGTNQMKPDVKYLLVSTYIIKCADHNYLNYTGQNFEKDAKMQFNELIDSINKGESFYNNTSFSYKECYLSDESAMINKNTMQIWTGSSPYPNFEKIAFMETNRRAAAVQVRANVINNYREKGYIIRQIEFKPNMDHKVWDFVAVPSTGEKIKVEQIEPLASWEVQFYKKGEMRESCNWAVKIYEDEKKLKTAVIKAETDFAFKKAKAKQEIKQEAEWLNSMDKNPLTSSNRLHTYKDAANALVKKCDYYLSTYGKDSEIEQIKKAAQFYAQSDAETLVNGVAQVGELLTSTPWSYGYGKFLGTESPTYIHRFNFGLAGSYAEGKIVSIDLSIMTNFMMLPSRALNYDRFVSSNGVTYNTSKTRQVENLQIISGSVGPAITIWPQKNIYLQVIPEAHLGMTFNAKESNAPINEFTAFPALNGKAGFRFGKFYLSGMYGTLWKSFKINEGSGYATEEGTINTPNGTVQGKYYATSFDNNKWVKNSYWVASIGFNFGN